MKRELKMTNCYREGWMVGNHPLQNKRSICWDCIIPVGECQWLTKSKPYEGMVYFERDCNKGKEIGYHIYSIAKCPHYKGIKDE